MRRVDSFWRLTVGGSEYLRSVMRVWRLLLSLALCPAATELDEEEDKEEEDEGHWFSVLLATHDGGD